MLAPRPAVERPPAQPGASPRIRVFLVDDSAVVRGFVTRLLGSATDIEIVGTASDGESAIRQLQGKTVDVVILDVEMPVLDGLSALPRILAISKPAPKVVMASTLTKRGASVSIQALVRGAADYVPKPTSMAPDGVGTFGRDLLERIRAWGSMAQRERAAVRPPAAVRPFAAAQPPRPASARPAAPAPAQPASHSPGRPIAGLPVGFRPEALAIGCSTGGPQALMRLFTSLRGRRLGPIFVTQHMPPTFTAMFAEQLARASDRQCRECVDLETAEPDRIYLAPGDFHMIAEGRPGAVKLRRTQTPPENFCRPSVDPMLKSLAAIYRDRLLTVILTGMGHDGLGGCRVVTADGGVVLAQDEASSVVWGMPGAVAQAGLARELGDIDQIAARIAQLFGSQS
jgi:two-component system, chemotaxis family, protein-glutamate methylesterase/glutaminase